MQLIDLLDTVAAPFSQPIAVQRWHAGLDYRPAATMLLSLKLPDVRAGDRILCFAEQFLQSHSLVNPDGTYKTYSLIAAGGTGLVPEAWLQDTANHPEIFQFVPRGEDMNNVNRPYYHWGLDKLFRPTIDLGLCRVYCMFYAGTAAPDWAPGDHIATAVNNGACGALAVLRYR